jgi:hypothetical protein
VGRKAPTAPVVAVMLQTTPHVWLVLE